jgi:hypothetical protein
VLVLVERVRSQGLVLSYASVDAGTQFLLDNMCLCKEISLLMRSSLCAPQAVYVFTKSCVEIP